MRTLISSLTFVALAACVGQTPPGGNPGVDAGTEDSPVLPAEGKRVSGKTMEYFEGVAAQTTVTTDGVTPPQTASSLADGSYELAGVPVGSKIYLSVEGTGFRPTRNLATSVADADVVQDLYVMATRIVARQYTTLGRAPTAGTAFVAAELQRPNGTPLEGIATTDVTLVDAGGQPVPGVLGPYFFGAVGDIDPALTTATAYNGRSRVAFLDVPPGSFTLKVVDGAATVQAPVTTSADGASLALAKGEGGGGGGNPLNPTFATDVYPRLQRAAMGGLGCANCHTANGSGAVLRYDDPAATVLAAMQARPGVIDLAAPANSLLLTKPLYEPTPPQNHPNATFLDENDPDYKLILLWITQGAAP